MKNLFYDHIYLVNLILKRIVHDYSNYEDYKQVCLMELWECVKKYDESKNIKFSSFASKCIIGKLYEEIRSNKLIKKPRNEKIYLILDNNLNDYIIEKNNKYEKYNLYLLKNLNKIEKYILINKIIFNNTDKKLALKLNLNIKTVNKYYKNSLKKMKKGF